MTTAFDLADQLPKALDWLLQHPPERAGGGRWVSATALEQRVQPASCEIEKNLPYGSCGRSVAGMGGGWPIGGLAEREGLSLLRFCRRFLFDLVKSGQLRAYRPAGEGTCAGTRFRPAGAPLSAAERLGPEERRRRRHITHYPGYCGGPLCRVGFGLPLARFVFSGDMPTCRRCHAWLAKRAGLSADAPIEVIHDLLIEQQVTGAGVGLPANYLSWVEGRGLPEGHPDLRPADEEEPLDSDEPQPSDRDLELFSAAMAVFLEAGEETT